MKTTIIDVTIEHNYEQLYLFKETVEEKNSREIKELRLHCDKLRKSLFAKNHELTKCCNSLKKEIEEIKEMIYKTSKHIEFPLKYGTNE